MSVSDPAFRSHGTQLSLAGASRPLLAAVAVAVMLGGAWLLTYAAGGSHTAAPHAFYLPIVVAAVLLRISGGAVTGFVAGLLGGPLMPLDVTAGQAQLPGNWLLRGFF
ncbi:MAG: hypothetical protein WD336_04375, partial [Trueperaceae bacterium]